VANFARVVWVVVFATEYINGVSEIFKREETRINHKKRAAPY